MQSVQLTLDRHRHGLVLINMVDSNLIRRECRPQCLDIAEEYGHIQIA